MVKGEAREAGCGPPSGRRRIVSCRYPMSITFDNSAEGDADGMTSRIAAGIAESADLLQVDTNKSGLFPELSLGGVLQRLVLVHEASGQRPESAKWIAAALYQEHLDVIGPGPEQNNIDRHGRPRV